MTKLDCWSIYRIHTLRDNPSKARLVTYNVYITPDSPRKSWCCFQGHGSVGRHRPDHTMAIDRTLELGINHRARQATSACFPFQIHSSRMAMGRTGPLKNDRRHCRALTYGSDHFQAGAAVKLPFPSMYMENPKMPNTTLVQSSGHVPNDDGGHFQRDTLVGRPPVPTATCWY